MSSFKTLDEEAHFRDTHDVSTLLKDSNTPLSELPLLEKEKEELISVRIQKTLKKKLQTIARARGIGPTTLARMWIIEKLSAVS